MQSKYWNKLEYNKILEILSGYAKTYIGKDLCINLTPFYSNTKVSKALSETSEAVTLRFRKSNPPISYINNIDVWIKILESNGVLSAKALLEIARVLKTSRELKEYFYSDDGLDLTLFPILTAYFNSLYLNSSVESKILNSILDENTISDNASKKLYAIRKEEHKLEYAIKDKLNSFIHSSTYSKYIQESVITIRNDRYVIPVKEEFRGQIKGFIHDMSSSGSTVFIEPMAIFELNNQINNLKIEENIEIEKILEELTKLFYPITNELSNNLRLIGRLDFIFAKANYSIDINGIHPILNEQKNINLIKARHPLINKDTVVPIDINLGNSFSCLVITGPNTGGKTVTLKTVGLLCLMGMSGLHIPAKENSSIYVFDNIFADIGDEQSIQESLSTFSSHMLNIIEILNTSTANSLILVDELGSGTDPIEGSSLAISILETFYNKGCLIIATTHYPEIKNYALINDGFENASSEFDIENLKPTYKLLIGIPGKSNAFAISKRLGLDINILNRANDLISNDDISIEELLKEIYDNKLVIEKEKDEIDKNLCQITTLRKSLEQDNTAVQNKEREIIENAKIQARKILLDAKEEANHIIKEMNKLSASSGNNKELNSLRNTLNSSIKSLSSTNIKQDEIKNSISIGDINIGMHVFVNKFKQDGIILSLPNKSNQVQVQIGSLKTNININNLSFSNKIIKKEIPTNKSKSKFNLKSRDVSSEINVIGQNVEEAIFVIDKYLDDCAMAGLPSARIVHGKGTGKLREGIHIFLKKHPHVKSFRLGTFGEGEMGVTIVEIK